MDFTLCKYGLTRLGGNPAASCSPAAAALEYCVRFQGRMPPPASGARALLSSVAHRLRRVSPLAIMGRRPCLCMLAWLVRADVKSMASIAGRPERIRPLAEAGRGCTPLSLIERWQAVLEAEWTEAFGCPPMSVKGCCFPPRRYRCSRSRS